MKRRLSLALMIAFIVALIGAPAAFAADFRTDTSISIGDDEVINDDLYLFGTTITVNGIVNGDLFAAGNSLTVNGTVNGNVFLVGQEVTVNGAVSRGARITANNATIAGSIGEDLLLFGNSTGIHGGASIGRDLIATVSSLTLDGMVQRRFAGNAQTVTLNGSVGSNIDIGVGDLTITEDASIGGDLTYRSDQMAEIAGGADIGGDVNHEMVGEADTETGFSIGSFVPSIIGLIMTAVYGTALLLVFPRLTVAASNQLLENTIMSIGMGIVFLIVVPIVSVLVMITVIGIPLGLIALLLYGIALFSAQVFVGMTLGRLILSFVADGKRRLIQFLGLLLGLLILFGVSFIPYVGPWAPLVVVILGLGGLMLAIGRLRHDQARGSAQPAEG
jgi:cytoskeletal protein CcmA (bactofilin family)